MASGKNHDRAILVMTPIWTLTAAHYGGLWMGVLVGAAHFLGGWYLSPDLDLKSRPFLRWGRVECNKPLNARRSGDTLTESFKT